MFRRLLRSAIVLAVLVTVYQAYVLWAVPHMEPSLALRQQRELTPGDIEGGNQGGTMYQLLLSNYFPKDHWSQTRPPKVIANATQQVMLVFDEFKRRPGTGQNADGSPTTLVDIERIALLVFPTPPREGITPPRDAVILESPEGAHLEFDDFRPEVGHIGQITRGEFPGLIHIHSDMNAPGPEDDLLIETADMKMNTKLMYTTAPVRFRMGQNVGGGNELEIRFLADEHLKPNEPGLKMAGIDSLEIRRDVKMRLTLDTSSLLPGGKEDVKKADKDGKPYAVTPSVQTTDASAVAAATPAPKPPVDVSCSGPFTFDFVRYVASLDHDVELRQNNLNGPSDQLSCSRLDIHFAAKPPVDGTPAPIVSDPGKRQQRELGQLEPVAIVAEGHPVVMTSPSKQAQARGDRIQIAMRDQRVRISGGNDAMLVFGTNVLQAPVIDYQHPLPSEATAVGRFRATGPGSLRYVIDPAKPQQVLQAQWQTSVQLGREKGQPVLVLDGRPKIAFGAAGALTADQIRMYMRELEGAGTEGIAIGGSKSESKFRLAPDRLLATGRVEIASPTFTGRTQQLHTVFRLQPDAAPAAGPAGAVSPAAPVAAPDGKNLSDPTTSAPSAAPDGANLLNPATSAPGAPPPTQIYNIDADGMRLEVSMKGQAATPISLACDGNVLIKEVPLVPTNERPLEVRGGQLSVDRLDSKAPHVTLHGAASGQAAGSAMAQITGRGMTMLVDTVEADGGDNRVWSDGPGKATVQVTGNMTGNLTGQQQSAAPVPMDITWERGFRFDGQTIMFNQNVLVAGMDSTLRCDRLAAKLAAKVQLGKRTGQPDMNMSEVECIGQVAIENVTRDTVGVTAHSRMQLAKLTINQQTGNITGDGPGIIRVTRFGTGLVALPGQPSTAPQAAPAQTAESNSKLYFLRVDFHQGLEGNMYLRDLTFHERVRTVYGPVDAWEQELDMTRPESLPPDSITLTCDNLRLNEDPMAARVSVDPNAGGKRPVGPVQMRATGDVRIAGEVPAQGEFNVQADVASYEQSKDAFVLEGNTRTPAKLWRRTAAGIDAPPTEARKIRYVRSTGDVKVEGIQFLEIRPQDLQNAKRPQPPAK